MTTGQRLRNLTTAGIIISWGLLAMLVITMCHAISTGRDWLVLLYFALACVQLADMPSRIREYNKVMGSLIV